eukprot:gb/GEZN01007445.1/.p1 GENE.gb/GEZN01007445.1/~~gb/GEZN01007445.1/.p1  ORF type:complete len:113 (-),score=0.99 gb/GEZN01007445.1/:928-1266(-)
MSHTTSSDLINAMQSTSISSLSAIPLDKHWLNIKDMSYIPFIRMILELPPINNHNTTTIDNQLFDYNVAKCQQPHYSDNNRDLIVAHGNHQCGQCHSAAAARQALHRALNHV